ncbi:hypothetical protein [Oscillatoria sp. HE19RPO]|uniref:hypothetical protein n=1 Tax=Oscillatoria sp. HE19RPO TaxID=2954806 RepID=UPI0020C2FFEA|nr:hypothetical protein [Oscillatoria sp. HE19RPO]
MKLSVDRQEKKGPFGGTYYESKIKITLTEEEKEVADTIELMKKLIFDPTDPGDRQVLHVLREGQVSVWDLTNGYGVTAKCDKEADLGSLAFVENKVREKCKYIKAKIDNYIAAKNALNEGGYEEEF